MSNSYSQEEINEFLADMQAQFDSMVSELRDQVEALKAEIEALRFMDHSHYTGTMGHSSTPLFRVMPPRPVSEAPTLFEYVQDGHVDS